jgi:hypothetical protein
VDKTAPFSAAEQEIREVNSYRPIPISPNGEIVAWIFTLVLASLSGVLTWKVGSLPLWPSIFTLLTLLLALGIRFSRWLEANTSIELGPEAIRYLSPLRKLEFQWGEIKKLIASPAGNGWWIFVYSELGALRFQTATRLTGMYGREVRTGFLEGSEIVNQILRNADLGTPKFDGSSWFWEGT